MLYDPKWEAEPTTKPKLEPWRQLLLDAADYMERHGHAKNSAIKADGSVCFIGAISMAATGGACNFGDEYLRTYSHPFNENTPMVQAYKKMGEHVRGHAVEWNNDPDRPGSEVIAGMRECALK